MRESSSWTDPSEQQFYNAMKQRKGWQPREEDMKIVVSVHNHVNDRAWSHVMRYEELHAGECECPRLKRFVGKPKELSPKATLRSYLGYALPFDRHDWIVDRCGKEVRYITSSTFTRGRRRRKARARPGTLVGETSVPAASAPGARAPGLVEANASTFVVPTPEPEQRPVDRGLPPRACRVCPLSVGYKKIGWRVVSWSSLSFWQVSDLFVWAQWVPSVGEWLSMLPFEKQM